MTDGTLVTVIETATAERSDSHAARFVIPVPEGRAPSELAAEIEGALAPLDVVITALTPMSQRDLVLDSAAATVHRCGAGLRCGTCDRTVVRLVRRRT